MPSGVVGSSSSHEGHPHSQVRHNGMPATVARHAPLQDQASECFPRALARSFPIGGAGSELSYRRPGPGAASAGLSSARERGRPSRTRRITATATHHTPSLATHCVSTRHSTAFCRKSLSIRWPWGGCMLGFATVDLSNRYDKPTVCLTITWGWITGRSHECHPFRTCRLHNLSPRIGQ